MSRPKTFHGKRRTSIYTRWCSMIARCTNPKTAAYPNYGGRGITVCERWQSFPNFYADMGDPPPEGTLERIDNDLGYAPENCRWATRTEQNRNRRDRKLYAINGESMLLTDWAARAGIRVGTLHYRLKLGWPLAAAVSTPLVTDRKGRRRGEQFFDSSQGPEVAEQAPPVAAA